MYKQPYPEALSLASLGRSDSKSPERTCHGITTAGKACRRALKKGSREKYCYLHRDQQSATSRAKLLGARSTVRVVEKYEDDSNEQQSSPYTNDSPYLSQIGYPTPEPSPSPPGRASLTKTPPVSITYPPQKQTRPPSMPPSPPSSIYPPSPPLSIQPHNIETPKKNRKGGLSKLGRAIRKLFRPSSKAPKPFSTTPPTTPPLDRTFRRDELTPTRYPQTISPTSLPSPNSSTSSPPLSPSKPTRKVRVDRHRLTPLSQHTAKSSNARPTNIHNTGSRSPYIGLSLDVLRSTRTSLERSWETMWVPGIDGLGAHIICKGILHLYWP